MHQILKLLIKLYTSHLYLPQTWHGKTGLNCKGRRLLHSGLWQTHPQLGRKHSLADFVRFNMFLPISIADP